MTQSVQIARFIKNRLLLKTIVLVALSLIIGFILGHFYASIDTSILSLMVAGILILMLDLMIVNRIIKKTADATVIFYNGAKDRKPMPARVKFDKRAGELYLDTHVVSFPLDSNQYRLLRAVFSNTKKHWAAGEILASPGGSSWRKVYDAMTLVNKKAGQHLPVKLIELRDKTFSLNPRLLNLRRD